MEPANFYYLFSKARLTHSIKKRTFLDKMGNPNGHLYCYDCRIQRMRKEYSTSVLSITQIYEDR